MTLDIEFDRMAEGVEALPDFFEGFPTLNIIVISGKLNKAEVTERLFRFTRDNVLKGKRWARHFDVLDKKDDKAEAIRRAYAFAFRQQDMADKVRELIMLAESYLEKDETAKCVEVYQKIQGLAPGWQEPDENIRMFKGNVYERALDYLRAGEKIEASLLLGHYLEGRLRAFTRRQLGHVQPGLYECLKELEKARRISPYKRSLFQQVIRQRNQAIHHPGKVTEEDFESSVKNIKLLEADF
jgi:hypothetical protein